MTYIFITKQCVLQIIYFSIYLIILFLFYTFLRKFYKKALGEMSNICISVLMINIDPLNHLDTNVLYSPEKTLLKYLWLVQKKSTK